MGQILIPAPKTGDIVTFVAADGTIHPAARVEHVWERADRVPPLLNLDAGVGSPTSVPHKSAVVGASGFYWR